MRYTGCEMISLEDLLYIVLRQNDHCALAKKNGNSSQSSISTHSTSMDSTKCGPKIFGKISQKVPKCKTCICHALTTTYIEFILCWV